MAIDHFTILLIGLTFHIVVEVNGSTSFTQSNAELQSIPSGIRNEVIKVDLSKNLITTIKRASIEHLVNLKELNLESNQITFIETDSFRDIPIETLTLSENLLETIPPLDNAVKTIKYLHLQKCQIANISKYTFENYTNLHTLSLDDNPLAVQSSKTYIGLQTLQILTMDRTNVRKFPCFPEFGVTAVEFSGSSTKINEIPAGCTNDVSFKSLRMANVPLTDATHLYNAAKIKVLSLLSDTDFALPSNIFVKFDPTWVQLSKAYVDTLHFKYDSISYFKLLYSNLTCLSFSNYSAIETITVSATNIQTFPGRRCDNNATSQAVNVNFPVLRFLKLNSNNIHTMIKIKAPVLKTLNMNRNSLQDIPQGTFRNTPNIRDLDLSHNKLTGMMDLSGIEKLETLLLSYNSIQALPDNAFRGNNIKELDLSNNAIISISDAWLGSARSSLANVNLEANPNLKSITRAKFRNMAALDTLSLGECGLNEFDANILGQLPSLTDLDLKQNTLSQFADPTQYVSNKTLSINLKLNHFNCGPELCWTKGVGSNVNLNFGQQTCVGPSHLTTVQVKQASRSQLGCRATLTFHKETNFSFPVTSDFNTANIFKEDLMSKQKTRRPIKKPAIAFEDCVIWCMTQPDCFYLKYSLDNVNYECQYYNG